MINLKRETALCSIIHGFLLVREQQFHCQLPVRLFQRRGSAGLMSACPRLRGNTWMSGMSISSRVRRFIINSSSRRCLSLSTVYPVSLRPQYAVAQPANGSNTTSGLLDALDYPLQQSQRASGSDNPTALQTPKKPWPGSLESITLRSRHVKTLCWSLHLALTIWSVHIVSSSLSDSRIMKPRFLGFVSSI